MSVIFLIFLIFSIICLKLFFDYKDTIYVSADTDSKTYIIRNTSDKSDDFLKNSANMLAEINKRIEVLIEHLKEDQKYKNKIFIKKLIKNYNSSIISEAAIDERFTTFTINKQEMHICLRTRDKDQKLYDINILMYVVIHELAHLCNYDDFETPIQGHGKEFKQIFKTLLQEAINIGVYKHVNYSQSPQEYCGIMINSSII